uniref:Uncharacterized protein n=1 Tax=Globodera rostochiensis TaxID=31243 RepID=A0A914IBB7_GLORO
MLALWQTVSLISAILCITLGLKPSDLRDCFVGKLHAYKAFIQKLNGSLSKTIQTKKTWARHFNRVSRLLEAWAEHRTSEGGLTPGGAEHRTRLRMHFLLILLIAFASERRCTTHIKPTMAEFAWCADQKISITDEQFVFKCNTCWDLQEPNVDEDEQIVPIVIDEQARLYMTKKPSVDNPKGK